MTDKTEDFLRVALLIVICISAMVISHHQKYSNNKATLSSDTTRLVPTFMTVSAEEGLIDALEYYDIHHPDIVYAQAVLETGNFKSLGCLEHNNLFGLYNSRTNNYHKFEHWSESIIAYKEWIQRRYKPPEDYYKFLQRIRYATDSLYIQKLKQIVEKNESRRSIGAGSSNSLQIYTSPISYRIW